jgi:hypothetical protein
MVRVVKFNDGIVEILDAKWNKYFNKQGRTNKYSIKD